MRTICMTLPVLVNSLNEIYLYALHRICLSMRVVYVQTHNQGRNRGEGPGVPCPPPLF